MDSAVDLSNHTSLSTLPIHSQSINGVENGVDLSENNGHGLRRGSPDEECIIIQKKGGLSSSSNLSGFSTHLLLSRPIKQEVGVVEDDDDDVAIVGQTAGPTVSSSSTIIVPGRSCSSAAREALRNSIAQSQAANSVTPANVLTLGSPNPQVVRPLTIQSSSGSAGGNVRLQSPMLSSGSQRTLLPASRMSNSTSGVPVRIGQGNGTGGASNQQLVSIRLVQPNATGNSTAAAPMSARSNSATVNTTPSSNTSAATASTPASSVAGGGTASGSTTQQMINGLLQQARQLESRSILGHANSLDSLDIGRQIESSLFMGRKTNNQFKCVECCDNFFDKSSYQRHRERVSVLILYSCDPCHKRLTFYNKCALFTHVRLHKQGSIDPSRLSIHVISANKVKAIMQTTMRSHLEALKKDSEQIAQRISDLQKQYTNLQSNSKKSAQSSMSETITSSSIGTTQPVIAASSSVASDPDPDVTFTGISLSCSTASGATPVSQTEKPAAAKVTTVASPAQLSSPRIPADHCPVCQVSMTGGMTLEKHLVSGPERECALCLMRVVGSACVFKAHLAFHLGAPRVCPECGWTVPLEWGARKVHEAMRRHQRTACFHFQRVRVYLCQRCEATPRAFSSLKQLADHIYVVHTEKFSRCPVCRVAFPAKYPQQLAQHLHMVHGSQPSNQQPTFIIKCPLCTEVHDDSDKLILHVINHLSNNPRCQVFAFKCLDRCKQIFMDQKSLSKHLRQCKFQIQQRSQPEPVGLPCLLCDKAEVPRYTQRVKDILSHERSHLHLPSAAGVVCPWCCQRLLEKNIDGLLDHLKAHYEQEQRALLGLPEPAAVAAEPATESEELPYETSHSAASAAAAPPRPASRASSVAESEEAAVPTATEVTCHCGQNLRSFSDLQEHCASEKGMQHPCVPEKHYTEADETLLSCSACDKVMEQPALTEHIFSNHTSLCYFCNHARLTMRHLWSCLLLDKKMVGVTTGQRSVTTPDLAATPASSVPALSEPTGEAAAYRCTMCEQSYVQESELVEHTKAVHGVEQRHACAICGEMFDRLSDLQAHAAKRHRSCMLAGAESFPCWLCTKERSFSTKTALEGHIIRVHKVSKSEIDWSQMPQLQRGPPAIGTIKRSASTESSAEEHPPPPEGVSPKRLRLSDVGKSTAPALVQELYNCARCDFSSSDRSGFQSHIAQHRGATGSLGLQCHECGLVFASKLSTQLHLSAAHRIQDPANYVKRHYKSGNVTPPAPGSHACEVCQKVLGSADELTRHTRVHGAAFIRSKAVRAGSATATSDTEMS